MAGAVGVLALIELSFDPLFRFGEVAIRWQTLGVLGAMLLGMTIAARMASDRPWRRSRLPEATDIDSPSAVVADRPLRLDDMVLIIAAVAPGAVVGGRMVHAIVYWDAYATTPERLFDPSVGSLSLLGAVIGGLLTASYVARLIGAPVRRWADAAAVPLLLVVGLGKIAQLVGGSGQGMPFDGSWAVAFTGGGPWVSANADLPSHPSQLYEGLWALIGIPIMLWLAGPRRRPVRADALAAGTDGVNEAGRLFVSALSWFLLGRVLVGFTWRDQPSVGPLNSEQALALVALVGVELGYRFHARGRRRHAPASARASSRSVP